MEEDLYAVLGVDRGSSDSDIKSAYRKLARQYHPDVNPGDKAAEEKFKKVGAAFGVLSDPEKRKMYDEFGADAVKLGFDPEKARAYREWSHGGGAPGGQRVHFDFGDMFGGGGGGRTSSGGFPWEDLFSGFGGFGGFGGAEPTARAKPNRDIHTTLSIDLGDSLRGSEKHLTIDHPSLPQAKKVKVKIPKGIEDGQQIRLPGAGVPGPNSNGHLYIEIRLRPHPQYTREGRNLLLDLPITVNEAMLGGTAEVPTPTGNIKLTIPAGAQAGTVLRLRGKGMPGKTPGDMMIRLQVVVPENTPTPEVRAALDTLASAYDGDVRSLIKL